MNKLVTIIIPVYNVEKHIIRCLNSVIKQTYKHLEILIIDDCGQDSSIILADRFISDNQNPNIKFRIIHHSKNLGVSQARNTGIKEAYGDYIYFLDSDDELQNDAIELLYNSLVTYDTDFSFGNNSIIQQNGKKEIRNKIYSNFIGEKQHILTSYLQGKWYNVAWNKLVKKDFLLENKLFFPVGYLHEDELWSFKLAVCANKMSIVHKSLYNYYINEGSIMHQDPVKRMLQYVDLLSLMKDYIKEKELLSNNDVSRFFLLKIVSLTVILSNKQVLTSRNMQAIKNLCYFDLYNLYCDKVISFKEMIAYLYLSIPFPFTILYYRLISFFS